MNSEKRKERLAENIYSSLLYFSKYRKFEESEYASNQMINFIV